MPKSFAILPSMRDGPAIREIWCVIDRFKPKLNSHFRNMRKYKTRTKAELSLGDYKKQQRFFRELKTLRHRLQIWRSMGFLVERHVDPNPIPLIRSRPANEYDAVLDLTYFAFHKLANPNPQQNKSEEFGCFPDIALSIRSFESLMSAAYRLLLVQGRSKYVRFLDVGCGGATKVYVASRYFQQCDGLEYDTRYVDAARNTLDLLQARNCEIHSGDGVTFENYKEYDVIYFYRPLRDNELLAKMERQIMTTARPGTIVVAPYDSFFDARDGFAGAKVTSPIFIAGVSQTEADHLQHNAERTSVEHVYHSVDYAFDTGFWTPIMDAASFNGDEEFSR